MITYAFFILLNAFFTFPVIDNGTTIIFFGDSITAGYGVGTDLAFPAVIGEELKKDGFDVEIVNAGLSGETSAGGLTRIDWILNRHVDVFVLELGANDGLRGLPVAETEKNLQAIIDKVKAKYPEVTIVIAGMMVPPNMGPAYSKSFQSVFTRISKNNDAVLVPFLLEGVAGDSSLNQPDGIHPNVKGHEIVAQTVYAQLKGIL